MANVFTIPASAPFLPTLIGALLDDRLGLNFRPGDDPLALAKVTLYLPTRRACRLASEAFLQVLKRDAAVLPRIVPIGDVDEDEIAFAEDAAGETAGAALELPKALGNLERKVLLAQLILAWANSPEMRRGGETPLIAHSAGAALALAGDLARLIDDMVMRQVPWDRFDRLVPDDFDKFWQDTLRFLDIARERWPGILAERNRIEPAERRNLLIEAEAARLANSKGPVIAAGSTGSIPVTAALLATIARLPHGALVLPGLDTDLDQPSWQMIGGAEEDASALHGHPQFAMQALLRRIGIDRASVDALALPLPHGRELLCSEALRPAAATELWKPRLNDDLFMAHADAALATVSMIEASNAEEEALAIAVALRETANDPNKTAALVTPDRALARRVLAALRRWAVPVDDSGGDPLADTPAGVFARLVAEASLRGLAPVTLLAMLKHPCCKLDPRAVAALERAILRGPRPKKATAGLAQTLASFREQLGRLRRGEETSLHHSEPRTQLRDRELEAATDLAAKLAAALAPLESLPSRPQPFADIAKAHAGAIQALGVMSEELATAFDEIVETGALAVTPSDYSELFHAALADRRVRRPEQNVRVRIFGTVDARLISVDRLVLGGLVEGVWPPETRPDPWLNRPMRHTLGLDLPERRIGLSAHDFAQALGAPEVILSRAAKLGGTPTVPSRFVQRLAAVAGEERWKQIVANGGRYLDWARSLDRPEQKPKPVSRPEPKPPLSARPKSLSVTEIELWLRDPYSIYARHILRLRPLDPVDTPPGARDRGTVVHGAIGVFTQRYKDALPADPLDELLRLGEEHFARLDDVPDAKAFWWPRFQRIARWFAGFESQRRNQLTRLDAELSGKLEIPLAEGAFTLRARADRIEHRSDGRYAILDYKTGRTATPAQVRTGFAPQLPLEGAILRGGGFEAIAAGASIAEFTYVSLRGGNPPGKAEPVEWKDSTPDHQADTARDRLTKLVTGFAKPDMAYRPLERPMFLRRNAGDYDHLSRVKEWSLSAGAADPEEAGGE